MVHGDDIFLRFSIQAFNDQNDLDRLYAAVEEIIAAGDLMQKQGNFHFGV